MAHILTMTLNSAVDTTYTVPHLLAGEIHRVDSQVTTPGGKGNNVARILANRGHDVRASGFLGGPYGEIIRRGLADANVGDAFVSLGDERNSRVCISILDGSTGHSTEILESGPHVTPADYARLIATLPEALAGVDAVVVSGSAPQGTDENSLAELSRAIRQGTSRYLVDASGSTLIGLLAGRPDVIKPNMSEFRAASQDMPDDDDQLAYAQQTFLPEHLGDDGAMLITSGSRGAWLVTRERILHGIGESLQPVNTVGCGDATAAGFVEAWIAGAADEDRLRHAVAFGSAAALQPVAGVADGADIDHFETTVRITG